MWLSYFAAAVLLLSARWRPQTPEAIATTDANEAVATAEHLSPTAIEATARPQASTLREALYPVVPIDEPALVIDLSDRQVQLHQGGTIKETYPIAVGQEGWETPIGTFHVIQKQVNPYWRHPITGAVVPPGPDNPLGSRWIGFWTDGENQIGFHGTNRADLIGQAVSHGCVRMRDEDIQELYPQVALGTTVIVQQ
jgi:L,D-transpeptidase ErfK/SrfK